MKTLLASAIILMSALTLHAQRTVDVEDFTKISFGVPGTLYLTQGSQNKVEVHADEETMDRIEVVQESGRLKIRNKNNYGWGSWNSSKVTVYVTMKTVEALSVSGSGSIVGKNAIKSDDMDLDVSGSGSIEMDLNAANVDISISGSGEVTLNGSGQRADVDISGSGEVKGEGFSVDVFEADISGSGTCYITANTEIDADISGSGSIYYKGNPDRVNSRSSGSGKVRKL